MAIDKVTVKRALPRVVNAVFAPLGFKRKGTTWRRTLPEVIQVINLQASSWGGQRYVNLGIFVSGMERNPEPREELCQIRIRVLEEDKVASRALDVDDETLSLTERSAILVPALQASALPFFELFKSEEDVRRYLIESRERDPWITKATYDYFGLDYYALTGD